MPASSARLGSGLFTSSGDLGACESGVFCHGSLLDVVQMSHLFPDSKTFVDKKLKHSPGKIIRRFEDLLKHNDGKNLSRDQLIEFIEKNFDDEGLELERWTPEDWREEPHFGHHVSHGLLKRLVKSVNYLLKDLSRKMSDDVQENPQLYSIIYVPNGFIVPGGRFREFYYWDTYWIVKALLRYDMGDTVEGMIANFVCMVQRFGLVPNGGRIYYTKRSQPPVLTLMMDEYLRHRAHDCRSMCFLVANIKVLEQEMSFWEEHRTVSVEDRQGNDHDVFVFGSGGAGPRPESYREDVLLGRTFAEEDEREEFFYHIKAGAESGWDFSSRWMIDAEGRNEGGLRAVRTNYIIPVDLNSFVYMNYVRLSDFHKRLGDNKRSQHYADKAERLRLAIRAILWDDNERVWLDYDILNDRRRNYFYPSNLTPLWAECYLPEERSFVAISAVEYMERTGAIYCKGGVPTSLDISGQQWDFPNAWPPLQHILVDGLMKTGEPRACLMAEVIARRYTLAVGISCPEGSETCNMFEKYHANAVGSAGGGGEYEVQTGFGWSNGVIVEFIATFGDRLMDEELDEYYNTESFKQAIELNTEFDVTKDKSKLVRRNSTITDLASIGVASDANLDHPLLLADHHLTADLDKEDDDDQVDHDKHSNVAENERLRERRESLAAQQLLDGAGPKPLFLIGQQSLDED